MSGMTEERLKEIKYSNYFFLDFKDSDLHKDFQWLIEQTESLSVEIRRLREENERLEKQLKGIGAEQYYSMRQRFWDEQKKNVALHKKVIQLERKYHVDMNNYRSDIQTWQEDYERRYVDLAKQNAELAEVLRLTVNNLESVLPPHVGLVSDLGKLYTILDQSREILRKYGLEGTE